MAKRFTDTEKWKKSFIRSLKSAYKLLWFYVCDDCDYAGIWQVDMDVAALRIGENITLEDAVKSFEGKIISIDGGSKWFIPSFVEFQYPSGLNVANKAHAGIIKVLSKYHLLDEIKGLASPLQGAKDKEQGKGIIIDNVCEVFKKIKHLEITKEEYNKLLATGYTAEQVEDIFNAIENYKKITSYTSLYLTALKWLKKEHPEVTAKKPEAKVNPIYEEELPTRKVKSVF